MSDKDKNLGSREEFEGKDVKNNLPQLDDEAYKELEKRNKSFRNSASEDEEDDEPISTDNNDIINSLLEFSKNDTSKSTEGETKKSGLPFIKKKESNGVTGDALVGGNNSEPEVKKGFGFGKKKSTVDKASEETYEEQVLEGGTEESAPLHKEKPKKEKKSLFKKKQTDEDIMDQILHSNDDVPDEVDDRIDTSDYKVSSFDEIQKNIRFAPKNINRGENKKVFIILGAVLAIAVFAIGGIFLIRTMFAPPETPEQPNTDTPVIQTPVEDEKDEFTSSNVDGLVFKQGKIKRILGNKVLIVPDGEIENVIYYVDSVSLLDAFNAGDHIEYSYKIQNYLPYITNVVEIQEGVVAYKGIMTLNIMVDNVPVKFAYASEIENEIKDIETGDTIQYVAETIDGVLTITNIINIESVDGDITDGAVKDETAGKNPATDDLFNGYVYNEEDFFNEHLIIEGRPENDDDRSNISTDIENGTIEFYNGLEGPIWIRFAWRSTDVMENVPGVDNVGLKLVTPSGKELDISNIDEVGRMWMDGNIVNYALKAGEVGEYKIVSVKPNGTYFGEAALHVMELSGFISIDKFGANLIDRNTLELVWNIGGVPDDGLEIEVYLSNNTFSTKVYSASSKDETLHIIDNAIVDVSNLPKGKYNVVVTVRDIDLKTSEDDPEIPENTIQVTARTIKDTKNMGILILQ